MRHPTACIALVLTLAAALSLPAESRGGYARYRWQAPVKDCTRLNGRWGYYGNPWCSPAEQLLWDRWDARRR
jgi:hypothetical protein